MMMASNEDHQSNLFFELCSLLFTFLRSPHLVLPPSSSDHPPPLPSQPPPRRNHPARRPMPPVTPAAFASLLLGASLALMICGSVTFVIGFILMPWVLGIVMLFYFLGILSNVTGFWMALFCPLRKEISDCKESNVEQDPDNRSTTDICTELREALERYEASQAAKIETESEPEPKVAFEPEPEPEVAAEVESEPTVVNEPEPDLEIEEPLVETSTDLPAEFVMEPASVASNCEGFLTPDIA